MARHGRLLPRGRDEPGVPLAGRKLGLAPGRVKARCARSTASRSSYAILGVRGTLLTILRGFRTGRLRNPAFGFCGLLPGSDEAQINTERFWTLSDVAVSCEASSRPTRPRKLASTTPSAAARSHSRNAFLRRCRSAQVLGRVYMSIISFDAILGAFSASFVGSDRPTFRKRRVRPRRCAPVQFT